MFDCVALEIINSWRRLSIVSWPALELIIVGGGNYPSRFAP